LCHPTEQSLVELTSVGIDRNAAACTAKKDNERHAWSVWDIIYHYVYKQWRT